MKLSQKRNCNGCKAYISGSCDFRIPLTSIKTVLGIDVLHKPVAPCYKPKNYKQYEAVVKDQYTSS